MHGATIRVKLIWRAIGAMACPSRLFDPGRAQLLQTVAWQIKLITIAFALREKAQGFRGIVADIFEKFRANLIGLLTDTGSDDRANILPPSTEGLHGRKGILQHTQLGALVARMRGTNDAGCRVMEQDRLAVGCEHPQDHAGTGGYHGISFGRIGQRRCEDLHVCRMDLMHRLQVIGWLSKEMRDGSAIVLHRRGRVVRASAAVQPVI